MTVCLSIIKKIKHERMDRTLSQFFNLLRAGIGTDIVDPELFRQEVKWNRIYEIAENQTLLAIIFDGIEQLMSICRNSVSSPHMELLMDWIGQVAYIEKKNKTLNTALKDVYAYFRENGLSVLLLKGQGCASLYPKRNHRNSGDIDLFVGLDQYELAKQLVVAKGIKLEKETRKDMHFKWNEIIIECHKMALHYYSPVINKPLQKINREEEWHNTSSFVLDGLAISLPNPTYNAFFIFMHIHHHFVQTGIGLRQICDWTLLLQKEENNIDWRILKRYIHDVRATLAWVTFYGFAKKYLGLKLENEPDWMKKYEDKDVEFLLDDILEVGNFGKHSESFRHRSFNKGWLANYYSFFVLFKRLCRVSKYGREEVVAYPIWKIFAKMGVVRF